MWPIQVLNLNLNHSPGILISDVPEVDQWQCSLRHRLHYRRRLLTLSAQQSAWYFSTLWWGVSVKPPKYNLQAPAKYF